VKSNNGSTPLHIAVRQNNLKNIELLLQKGAQVLPCNWGNTPLDFALGADDPKILALFTKYKYYIHQHDEKERTPLDVAWEQGKDHTIQYLLSIKAMFSLEKG